MSEVLIFGGTSDARLLSKRLKGAGVAVKVHVAYEYGKNVLEEKDDVEVGKLDIIKMIEAVKGKELVIDLTHPFAVLASDNIKRACDQEEVSYLRIKRDDDAPDGVKYVSSIDEAVLELNDKEGNVFVSTGSKDLHLYSKLNNFKDRLFVRVLPWADALEKCEQAGISGKNIMCMQGPFSTELNVEQLRHCKAEYMVTKQSGAAGGFYEKLEAASRLGIKVIVIGRPKEREGVLMPEAISVIEDRLGVELLPIINIIGFGVNDKTLTVEAEEALRNSDVIIGSERAVSKLKKFNKKEFIEPKSSAMAEIIKNNSHFNSISVVFSGDIGYFSGAKSIYEEIEEYSINNYCGISSMQYFLSKLKMGWDDVKSVSLHGKSADIVSEVRYNQKVITLIGKDSDIMQSCLLLEEEGLGDLDVFIGTNLGDENERILSGSASSFTEMLLDPLSIMLILNPDATEKASAAIEDKKEVSSKSSRSVSLFDKEISRESVPMTKEEVRAVSIQKMGLKSNSIIYDIGSGTGSVSIQAALNAPDGHVYAIECDKNAFELTEKNISKFNIKNISSVFGQAPEAINALPMPDCVFIGGSKGRINDILAAVLEKNPAVRIVVNTIALESTLNTIETFKKLKIKNLEVIQLGISKSDRLGRYIMLSAQNPIFIISGGGKNA